MPTDEIMAFGWYDKLLKKYKNEDVVIKLLRYIYFMSHSDSFINEQGITGEKAIAKAKLHSALPDNVDLKDPLVKLALSDVAIASKDNVKDSINRMLKALDRTSILMDKLLDNIDTMMLTGKKEDLQTASENLKTVMDLSGKVPTVVQTLKEALSMYKENTVKKELAKGGDEIPDSFEGNNDIEND